MKTLNDYVKITNKLKSKLDTIYNRIQFITVGDIIDDSIDLKSIWDTCHDIYILNNKLYKKVYDTILEKIPDDKLKGEDLLVDNTADEIDKKVSSIQSIIDNLQDLSYLIEDEEIVEAFKDIKNLK